MTPADHFLFYQDLLVDFASRAGIKIRVSADKSLPLFSRLDEVSRDHVLSTLQALARSALDCQPFTTDSDTVKPMLRAFLGRSELTVPAGVYEKIRDDDSVDIYNESHRLIFASLNFLKLPSYSLEELYCRPWTDLYTRDVPGVAEDFFKLAVDMVEGRHRDLVDTSYITNHVVYQTGDFERRAVASIPRFFAPVFSRGVAAGYICVTRYALISEGPARPGVI